MTNDQTRKRRGGSDSSWLWGLVALFAVLGCLDAEGKLRVRDGQVTEALERETAAKLELDVMRRRLLEVRDAEPTLDMSFRRSLLPEEVKPAFDR